LERLVEMFEEIVDVRDSSGKRHCLTHILVMSVYLEYYKREWILRIFMIMLKLMKNGLMKN
jgi:hypothetical protein